MLLREDGAVPAEDLHRLLADAAGQAFGKGGVAVVVAHDAGDLALAESVDAGCGGRAVAHDVPRAEQLGHVQRVELAQHRLKRVNVAVDVSEYAYQHLSTCSRLIPLDA